jgi:hypothetical protein
MLEFVKMDPELNTENQLKKNPIPLVKLMG